MDKNWQLPEAEPVDILATVTLGLRGNGEFVAMSSEVPYFCFVGRTESEVMTKAGDALHEWGCMIDDEKGAA